MSSPATSTLLNYNLYSNKKRATLWGEGINSVALNSNKPIKIYGRIPSGQMVEAEVGPLPADGGQIVTDVFGNLPALGWENLTRTFFRT